MPASQLWCGRRVNGPVSLETIGRDKLGQPGGGMRRGLLQNQRVSKPAKIQVSLVGFGNRPKLGQWYKPRAEFLDLVGELLDFTGIGAALRNGIHRPEAIGCQLHGVLLD